MESSPLIGGSLENANDIYNNTPTNLHVFSSGDPTTEATYNYWGTDIPEQLDQQILGDVNFIPITDMTHTQVIYGAPQSVKSDANKIPSQFELLSYPNPFNQTVTFVITSVANSLIELTIYDLAGKAVWAKRISLSGEKSYPVVWSGETNDGIILTSGIYFAYLHSQNNSIIHKITLVK